MTSAATYRERSLPNSFQISELKSGAAGTARFFGGGDGLREGVNERGLFFAAGLPAERVTFDDVAVPALLRGTGVLDLGVAGVLDGNGLVALGRCANDAEPLAEGK